MIEKVTGVNYEEYIKANILKPLDMTDTSFFRSEKHQDRTATGSWPVIDIFTILFWKFADKDFFDTYIRVTEKGRMWMNPVYTLYTPSTGLSGTSRDLSKFAYLLLKGIGLNGTEILDPSLLKEMQVLFPMDELAKSYNKGESFGFGLKAWQFNKQRIYGHGGGGPGYGALLAIIPDRNLVITINANDTNIDRDKVLQILTSITW